MKQERPESRPGPGEFDLIRWFRARTGVHDSVVQGIGDDCAILRTTRGDELVVTTDMLMDGRHFNLEKAGAEAVGYKAMAVNISDIAAMAARPTAAVASVALPRTGSRAAEIARGLHAGILVAGARYGVALVGGDTNAWDGPLVVSITLLGETTGRGAVRRSGAKPGDVIYVTGPLGGSLRGRHLRPTPRVDEAILLNALVPLHALIDISDGLTADLAHILEESGNLGALLDADAIPIHSDAREMSLIDGISPLDHALGDGEDFELCFVTSAEDSQTLQEKLTGDGLLSVYRIGQIMEDPHIFLRGTDGRTRIIEAAGFDHLRS